MITKPCLICGVETCGSYGAKWPLCLDCYVGDVGKVLDMDERWEEKFMIEQIILPTLEEE